MFFRNAKNGAVREWLCPSDENNYLCFEKSAFTIYYVGLSDTMCKYIYIYDIEPFSCKRIAVP